MKKMKSIGITVLAIALLVGCKKTANESRTEMQETSTQEIVVRQSTYNLSTEQTTTEIKKFKNRQEVNLNIPMDSAQWILEAALNFDFDSTKTQTDIVSRELISIVIQESNINMINSRDLQSAYRNLYNQISGKISANKAIFSIDIYVIKSNSNLINLKANVITFKAQANQKTTTITTSAIWSTTEYMYNTTCGTPSGPDAALQVQSELDLYLPHGPRSCYWTNLVSHNYSGYQNQSALFYWSTLSSSFCYASALTLSAGQQNSYVSSAYTLANSIAFLGSPDFNDFQMSPVTQPPVVSGDTWKFYWNMYVTYGKFNC